MARFPSFSLIASMPKAHRHGRRQELCVTSIPIACAPTRDLRTARGINPAFRIAGACLDTQAWDVEAVLLTPIQ